MEDGASDLQVFLKVLSFSAERHRKQRRKGVEGDPYINHPVEVANLLANVAGVADITTLVAAVLHDTVEDTETGPEEIEALFGRPVRLLVEEVTDDKSLPKLERKRRQVEGAPGRSPAAKLIKIADKICNLRDLTQRPPADWSRDRRSAYFDWAEAVVAGCRGLNPALEECFYESLRRGREVLAGQA